MRQEGKIIVTGTGRAGTTFLMQLFTALGLDTGFASGGVESGWYEHCRAGLERDPHTLDGPRILKNPAFCETLPTILKREAARVECVIVPLRDLDEAAASRARVGEGAPGGLWDATTVENQKQVLAVKFYGLIRALVAHRVAFRIVDFPRIVRDVDYAYDVLEPVVRECARDAFIRAFEGVARPDLVHGSAAVRGDAEGLRGTSAGDGVAATRWRRTQARRRIGRRLARGVVVVSALLVGYLVGLGRAGG
ncbi:hypothetical protein ASA1KI_27340 [Opitutales bacterium ASA1]|uniref:hypothetical protein n=1 Tax=Congregicoccus parvus TaxID=3081749 RepID=UPI002B2A7351|nr:hypothetical protein ASA1KI_27340 [Opitutales bacterium ASA1]